MRNKSLVFASVFALAALLLWTTGAAAQLTQNPGKGYNPPRTADGHPDLNGTYDLATITQLIRPNGAKRALTDEEAAKMEAQMAKERQDGDAPLAPDRAAPPKGNGDQDIPVRYRPATGGTGGYNTFWIDPGSKVTVVNGEKRSSIIVDPPDGKVPPMTRPDRIGDPLSVTSRDRTPAKTAILRWTALPEPSIIPKSAR